MRREKMVTRLALMLLFLFFHSNAWALLASNDFFGLDFRFNNPGARANAMGGAFIAVADDATAAYTNPAGLTILTEPEVSIEFKYTKTTNKVYDEVGSQEFEDDVFNVSFASFVYPAKKVTFALYRHQLVNIESQFEIRELPNNLSKVNFDLAVETLGLAAGFPLSDSFSLGFSVGFARADYQSLEEQFNNPSGTPPPESYIVVSDSDSSEQYTAALLWNPGGDFNIGLVYRYGPEFNTTKTRLEDDMAPFEDYIVKYVGQNTLNIPDVFGLGISSRFFQSLTMALDVNYVMYSDLLRSFRFEPGSSEDPSQYEIDDQFEIHFGLEYAFQVSDVPFGVRAGYFYRPEHPVIYTGTDPDQINRFQERDDDEHIVSAGFGFVIDNNLQLDLAAVYGQYITEGVLSAVYRF